MNTMKKQVVLYKKLSPLLMARLHEQTEVTLIDNLDADGLAQLREALPRAEGLLGASLKLDAGLLDLAPDLQAIASVSVGVDNYDIDYLTERRILLSNTPDVLTETTWIRGSTSPGWNVGCGQSGFGRCRRPCPDAPAL